jgi:hypothetical protein
MDDFLVQHLASLCVYYKLKRWTDLQRIQFGTSSDQLKKLEQSLIAEGLFKVVEQGYWPGTCPTAIALSLWPKNAKLAGIAIIVSRIAPFFYTEVLPREAMLPLDFDLATTRQILESENYQKYLAALKKPIPRAVKRLRSKVLPIVAANGFIHTTRNSLDRHPQKKGIPRFLQNRSIHFFYFRSTGY